MLTCIVMVSITNWEIGLSPGLVGSVCFLCYLSCAKINSRVWLYSISDCMHSVVHLLVIYQKVLVTYLISHRKIKGCPLAHTHSPNNAIQKKWVVAILYICQCVIHPPTTIHTWYPDAIVRTCKNSCIYI